MIYTDFCGKQLSLLGFGAMRLPQTASGSIDENQVAEMVDYALSHGVNYFDTAYAYHSGLSETVLGRILQRYPRDSWYLADKFPGHQISSTGYHPAPIFEEQLKKCGVDHFDFYLLHNVYENSIKVYLDPQWNIIEYFKEQKRLGRIRHLGFSAHGLLENLKEFLDACGEEMEFCQIQLNYLDWTLQNAKEKVALLNERHIPIWVMEPVRGGRLCKLPEKDEAVLRALRPDESVPAWGFRFLQGIDTVQMVLSGMSSLTQMKENIETFSQRNPLHPQELNALLNIAEGLKDSIPCTACRYCVDHCPKGLDIPMLLSTYNEIRYAAITNPAMRIEALPEDKRPSACVGCGVCARTCPQSIAIPDHLTAFSQKLAAIPSWASVCLAREEAAKKAAAK